MTKDENLREAITLYLRNPGQRGEFEAFCKRNNYHPHEMGMEDKYVNPYQPKRRAM